MPLNNMSGATVILTGRDLPLKNFAVTLLVLILSQLPSAAQQEASAGRHHGSRSLTVFQITEAPVLDGLLNEQAWKDAAVAGEFVQKDPNEGMPATERTEVRVLYDSENLYFGVSCVDGQAGQILARELRRDDSFRNDDSFSIILDTFHDHRNASLFRVNPSGTQYDALITEEGREVNSDWDEKWEVETQVDEEGWSAEIKIPLQTIRFSSSNTGFGIDFERVVRRKNEFSYWNNYLRNFTFQQVSQAGHLVGLMEVEAGLKLRVKPYINTRMITQGAEERNTSFLGDLGLEDLKYSVTSGLTLDVTINTDFAQTEADNQVINFDRFPVFFPEKREFFMEGAGIFGMVPLSIAIRPDIKLYHSRRIGLSEDREVIPMLAGAKLTGKLGKDFTLGILEAQTDDFQDRAGDNYAVFRLKRDLFSRSSVGFFFTNRQGEQGDFNRVLGVDQNLIFLEHLKVGGFLARSFTDGVENRQWTGGLEARWDSDLLIGGFNYIEIQENFQSDLGFIRREAVRLYRPILRFLPRPHSSRIRQLRFAFRLDHVRGVTDNELVTENYHFDSSIFFQDGSSMNINGNRLTDNLVTPLSLPGGLVVAPGKNSWWKSEFRYRFNPALKLNGSLGYNYHRNYYGTAGSRHEWLLNPVVKFNSSFSVGINYSINRIELPGQEVILFQGMDNRFNLALSRKWLISALFQYNSDSDVAGVNFRLNYIYRPGDDLFIVFNDFRDSSEPTTEVDRQIVVKFTHSFDF